MFPFNVDDFCTKFHHFPIQVLSALKILHRAGYMEFIEEQESQARVMFMLERDELYRLNNTSETEDRIITTLLRHYGGLFVDYVFIDEAFVAAQTGLQVPLVYMTLKGLSQKNILRFIPQKRTPYIRYMQRREDAENLLFPPSVYEELKQRYAKRIAAIIAYAKTDDQCRSRQLLRYFGETDSHDCHQCDVCLGKPSVTADGDKPGGALELILQLLADHQPHHITELRNLPLPYEEIDAALEFMLQEEYVYQQDSYLVEA
jgi:ATP-dependent DNA helicase RecQ